MAQKAAAGCISPTSADFVVACYRHAIPYAHADKALKKLLIRWPIRWLAAVSTC
jgi:hypothetical protein